MNEDLEELYRRKEDLLEKFNIAKSSVGNRRLWEVLPAIERAKYAKWYFEYCQRAVEEIDDAINMINGR